ncbi:hypothetical protein Dimus_036126 [Dionaea muscipula]
MHEYYTSPISTVFTESGSAMTPAPPPRSIPEPPSFSTHVHHRDPLNAPSTSQSNAHDDDDDASLEESQGRLWDVNVKPSLSSLQWAGIVSGSPDLSQSQARTFVSLPFLSPEEEDPTGFMVLMMTMLDLMSAPRRSAPDFSSRILQGRGRRGARGRGRPDSPDRARVSTRDLEDHDRRSSRDAEDRHPKPPSAESTSGKGVVADYPGESKRRPPTWSHRFPRSLRGRELVVPLEAPGHGSSSFVTPASYDNERFKYEMIDGHRVELDSNGNILPRDLRFAGPQPKICGLPYPDDGFICCESNALALVQAMANVSLTDLKVYRHETKGRMTEWMGRDINWNLVQV